jgi:hypothetical protein
MKIQRAAKAIVAILVGMVLQLVNVGPALAYESGDCDAGIGWGGVILEDFDLVRADTGSNDVDLGANHWWGAPRDPAIICWGLASGGLEVELIGDLYWDPQGSADRYGTAHLAVSFSQDGENWQQKVWFDVRGNGFTRGYIEKTFKVPTTLDHIRLQLYRNSNRVYTFHRARGD